MQVMKWSALALAVTAGTTQLAFASAQDESKGFVEDSSLKVLARNLYINRDYHRGGDATNYRAVGGNPAGYTSEWGQGFIGTFESGFTQGTVGVGVDAYGLLGIKLDSGKGRAGILEMPMDSDGRSQDEFSEAGAAVKVRVSNSVLKYGNQFVALPVFATDDSRLLPEATTGTLLTVQEIEGLTLNAGRFTALNQQWQTDRDSGRMKSINVYGGTYAITEQLSTSLFASDLEDTFKKKYANVNLTVPLADEQSLGFDFNIYKTDYDKKAYGSSLDNTIWSLAASYTMGAHKFTVAHQRSNGDTGYDYGADGGGTIYLANSIQVKDFNAEDETSWQARYDIDMASFGVPGLTFMARYVTSDNATIRADDRSVTDSNAGRWERNFEAKYVVQDGAAKDLSFRVRQATVRSDSSFGSSNDLEDVRLIVEYPLSIL
ncbi:OprD family porin [Metapseudomonas otitidis]|uniref:Porin D n=1 Tax=Metapseudomonas otitidis TaxID=319939 RepID=A0A6S5S199_9GAMM|nr:OprD family porin [Pseudomonas otitidis]MBO2926088.1 OprD family porin [Pseudomonas otitidis]BBT18196.1 porin D [Pseudomonas otitidis]